MKEQLIPVDPIEYNDRFGLPEAQLEQDLNGAVDGIKHGLMLLRQTDLEKSDQLRAVEFTNQHLDSVSGVRWQIDEPENDIDASEYREDLMAIRQLYKFWHHEMYIAKVTPENILSAGPNVLMKGQTPGTEVLAPIDAIPSVYALKPVMSHIEHEDFFDSV